jgi:uncharacterized membrane protein YkoI
MLWIYGAHDVQRKEETLKKKLKISLAVGATVAALATAVAVAGPSGTPLEAIGIGESETPIRGEALTKASAAALGATGGGHVTDTEVGDEEGYYEVEVKRTDGSSVDVHLDRDFGVLGQIADDERPDDSDSGG